MPTTYELLTYAPCNFTLPLGAKNTTVKKITVFTRNEKSNINPPEKQAIHLCKSGIHTAFKKLQVLLKGKKKTQSKVTKRALEPDSEKTKSFGIIR